MSTVLEIENLSKSFRPGIVRRSFVKWITGNSPQPPQKEVLKHINLSMQAGESLALGGANGAGKSTLLKIIAGILRPTSGSCCVKGAVVPLFSWNASFIDDLEALDNIYLFGAILGLRAEDLRKQLRAIEEFSGVQGRLNEQMRTFSPGMKARLAFAVAREAKAQLYLIDEALSVSDASFRELCGETIRQWKREGRAVIHVSHDLTLAAHTADRAYKISDGELREI